MANYGYLLTDEGEVQVFSTNIRKIVRAMFARLEEETLQHYTKEDIKNAIEYAEMVSEETDWFILDEDTLNEYRKECGLTEWKVNCNGYIIVKCERI